MRLVGPQGTVRRRLLRLVLLVLVPSLALAAILSWRSLEADRNAAQDNLRADLAGLGFLTDDVVAQTEAPLDVLAASDAAARGDIAALLRMAQGAAPFAKHILIADAGGHVIADSNAAQGPLPAQLAPATNARGRLSWISDGTGQPRLVIGAPIVSAGAHPPRSLTLAALVPRAALQAALTHAALPLGWSGYVIDWQQHVTSSSPQAAFGGAPPLPQAVLSGLRAGRPVEGRAELDDGTGILYAVGHSPSFGIPLVVVAPRAMIAQASRLSLIILVAEGILLVILGLAGARRVASSISRPIEALAVAAHELGEADILPPIPSGLREANQVARALRAAHTTLRERRAALSDTNVALAARVEARTAELASANKALEEQRAQLGTILDHLPIGVLVSEPSGNALFANQVVRELLCSPAVGELRPDIVRRLWRNGVEVPLSEAAPSLARRGKATERDCVTVELWNGNRVAVETSAAPIYDSDGRLVLAVCTIQDITARLEAEEGRRRSQRMEAVGQLTGGVAHEFNNVLMAIGGCIDLLRPYIRSDRALTLLDNAGRSADHGARLTRQLLAFARRQNLRPEPVSLNAVVEGMKDLLNSTLGRAIEIRTELPADGWPALADPTQLELVLLNLAINSRDAMPAGGRLTISTGNVVLGPPGRPEEPPAGDYAELRVTDTGTGMKPEVLSRAFEPFFTTKDVGRGSGLGLPQVLGVAQQLGGGVSIRSVPDEGTSVSVYLPRTTTPPAVRPHGPVPAVPAAPIRSPVHGMRLLLVDDDVDVREVARVMLEDLGALVTEAQSGPAALLCLRTDPDIELVLADFSMPDMTGLELAELIGDMLPDLPIVLMTGYSATAVGQGSRSVRAVLQKPFRSAQLATALREALGEDLHEAATETA